MTVGARDCATVNITDVGGISKRVRIITGGTYGSIVNFLINVINTPVNRDIRLLLYRVMNRRQEVIALGNRLVPITIKRGVNLRAVTRRSITRFKLRVRFP